MSDIITAIAPVNIAVIKYWGKRDQSLILPLNDSVSVTLDTNIMCAKTSVCARPGFTESLFYLNGVKDTNLRLDGCINQIKEIAKRQNSVSDSFLSWKVHVYSENNFPTAAGLASSAAGYACLVTALAELYKIKADLSPIARSGSGSACRSVYGGFVRWHAGVESNGSDSIATQVADTLHWPQMKVLILVVNDAEKSTSSTKGMQTSVETSDLLKYRAEHCVPKKVETICQAIKDRDFQTFAELTMKDSNQFHAVCLDTYPPCVYMNDTSHKIVKIIHTYNNICGKLKAAYTFDAGPNACIYALEDNVSEVLALIKHMFPASNPKGFVKGLKAAEVPDSQIIQSFPLNPHEKDLIKYVIHTQVGDGPQILKEGPHLIHDEIPVILTTTRV